MRFGFDFLPEDVSGDSGSGGSGSGDTPQATASAGYVDQVQDKNGDIYDIQDTQARSDIADLVSANFVRFATYMFDRNTVNDNPQISTDNTGDANTMTTDGIYYMSSSITNFPFSGGFLIVQGRYRQIAVSLASDSASPYIAVRYNNNGGQWHFITDTDQEYDFGPRGVMSSTWRIISNSNTAANNPDLNDKVTPGTYYGQGSYFPQNFPLGDRSLSAGSTCTYKLVVTPIGANSTTRIRQELYAYIKVNPTGYGFYSPIRFVRMYSNGTWTPWMCTTPGFAVTRVTDLDALTTPGMYTAGAGATGAPTDLANSKYSIEVIVDYADGWSPRYMQIIRYEYTTYIRYSNTMTSAYSSLTWQAWKKTTAT